MPTGEDNSGRDGEGGRRRIIDLEKRSLRRKFSTLQMTSVCSQAVTVQRGRQVEEAKYQGMKAAAGFANELDK